MSVIEDSDFRTNSARPGGGEDMTSLEKPDVVVKLIPASSREKSTSI